MGFARVNSILQISGSNQKRISRIYKGLQQTNCSSLYVKQKWQHEGNLVLKEEDWENFCEIQWKNSSSYGESFAGKPGIRYAGHGRRNRGGRVPSNLQDRRICLTQKLYSKISDAFILKAQHSVLSSAP